ncbi:MAG: 6-phosphofructokinase [Oscillospiraceae bacterium]|nr:6-phosphofructokinase [Oscillospiraceae bacterium]
MEDLIMSVKRIGVLTSGGDAPGMNACVRAVVRTALYHGIECYGIRRGYSGLIAGDVVKLNEKDVSHIINRGGTILYSARSKEFMTEEGQNKAVSTCKFLGLEGIIVIGGDGTFRGAQALSRHGINVIGIPGTIDNDISCTNYSIGFDTAANTAIECIDKLRDTMQSHERCSVVEIMGRHAGFLAMYVGLAVGATAVLVPEDPYDFEQDVIEKIRRARLNGFTHYMIVVAEGAGSAAEIAKRIKETIDLDPRVTVLGHIQRGGSPSGRDRVNATKMGYLAVELLRAGKTDRIVCTHDGEFTDVGIEEGLSMKRSVQKMELDILDAMTGSANITPAG